MILLFIAFILLVAFAFVGVFEAGTTLLGWLEYEYSSGIAWGAFAFVVLLLAGSIVAIASALIGPSL